VEARVNIDVNTARLLGTAQLLVFAASLVSERLLVSAVGTGPGAARLENVSKNLTRLRISNLVALVNCLAIIFLGAVFYFVFYQPYQLIALVAFGFFAAEAVILAAGQLGTLALVPASQEFATAGAPSDSHLPALGDLLYEGLNRRAYDIHMVFFCLGGILWYYLLYTSRVLPVALSLWGLIAICLLTVPVWAVPYNRELTQTLILGLPYAPFELVLGLWLLVIGFQ
jgi:hypothetical protein